MIDIEFLVVILGLTEIIDSYPDHQRRSYEIKKIVEDHSLESIDIVPFFEKNDPKSMRVIKANLLHFNQKGSQIIADAIYNYILK